MMGGMGGCGYVSHGRPVLLDGRGTSHPPLYQVVEYHFANTSSCNLLSVREWVLEKTFDLNVRGSLMIEFENIDEGYGQSSNFLPNCP